MWQGVSGLSSDNPLEPLREDMHFAIASITKTFIGALVLGLSEDGTLSLDDSLHFWLPPIHFVNPDVTVKQLLNHTSGIYNFTNNPAFWEALWLDPERVWMPEEILQNFLSQPVFLPGNRFEYSNTNYMLLGMIVEAATGVTLGTELRNRLFTPLELIQTYFTAEEQVRGEIANNWSDTDSDGVLEDISEVTSQSLYSMVWAAGGMSATAADMIRWSGALFEGSVLDADKLTEMLSFITVNSTSPWKGYGLGIMQFQFNGTEFWGHTGSLPGYRSILAYSPETGIRICVLVNQDHFQGVYTIASLLIDTVTNAQSTAITHEVVQSTDIVIEGSYPNPSNREVHIVFSVNSPQRVSVDILDSRGRRLYSIDDRYYDIGGQEVTWNAVNVASGVYFYRLTTASSSLTGTITRIK